ncbi:hypothetical protein [Rhodococcoides fascians]|uniref:hypothetical protein n=1 Tax=Rhodococcoides fascians TaxID=1828 RepID=UPI0012D2DD50|nr:hypothetical protein [Rhodococcus fascians]
MVVVVGAVVVGVAHGSICAGASSAGPDSGPALGVGTGVVVGCAHADDVPETNNKATVPAVNSERVAERDRRRGGRKGFDEIMDVLFVRMRVTERAARSIFADTSHIHNNNSRNNLY